jgi:hypothetical protein
VGGAPPPLGEVPYLYLLAGSVNFLGSCLRSMPSSCLSSTAARQRKCRARCPGRSNLRSACHLASIWDRPKLQGLLSHWSWSLICAVICARFVWHLYFVVALLVGGLIKSNARRALCCRPSLLRGFLPLLGSGCAARDDAINLKGGRCFR